VEAEDFAFRNGKRNMVDCSNITELLCQFSDIDYLIAFFLHGDALWLQKIKLNWTFKNLICTITSTFPAYNPQQYLERIPHISIV